MSATKKLAPTKKKARKTTRVGAAAFAIGLYLAGPHVGVAVADSADDTTSGSASAADTDVAQSPAGRGATRSTATAPERPARTTRSAGERAARTPGAEAPTARPAATASVPTRRSVARAANAQPNAQLTAPTVPVPPAAAVPARQGRSTAWSSASRLAAAVAEPITGPSLAAPAPLPAVFAAAPTSAPAAAPVAAVPPLLQKIDAQAQAAVTTVFRGLLNWVSTLPVNPATNFLEGALLMARKELFNQGTAVSSFQTANSSSLVTGQIDGIDPEGDGWTLEVVTKPVKGTVVLNPVNAKNGIGTATYSYIPGDGFDGSDQFVVKVTATDNTFNVLRPFGGLSDQYVTVAVGDAATPAKSFLGSVSANTLDTTLFMANAGATVTVKKEGLLFPRYTATVTLPAGAEARNFAWMDSRGRQGSVSLDKMVTEHWSALEQKAAQNATAPLLAFSYSDQGVDKTVFVDVSTVTKAADGSYQLSGQLMADATSQDGRVDAWDFLGINYKYAYENYLSSSGLADCKSGATCSSVSAVGILAATTFSVASAVEAGYHDYPLPTPGSVATQLSPGQLGWGSVSTDVTSGGGTNIGSGDVYGNGGGQGTTQMTAMIPYSSGGTFITSTNLGDIGAAGAANNGINLYTATTPTGSNPTWALPATIVTAATGTWDSPVTAILAYAPTAVDDSGNVVPATFTTTGGGATSPIPMTLSGSMAPAPPAIDPGSLVGATVTGNDVAAGTTITGYSSTVGGISTYTVNNDSLVGATALTVLAPGSSNIVATGTISAGGTTPANFTGSISGNGLTVTAVSSGTIEVGTYVVGGPANNTFIQGGPNGVGTYTVTPSQTWPAGGGTAEMTAGTGGTTLQITLPSPGAATPSEATFNGGISAGQGVNSPGNVLQIQIPVESSFEGKVATASSNTAVLTASSVIGTLRVGQYVQGLQAQNSGDGTTAAVTATISSVGTGTGGAGTYNLTLTVPTGYTFTSQPSTAMATCAADQCGLATLYGPNLVANSGFETPTQTASAPGNYTYNPTGGAWTFNGSSGIAGNVSAFTSGNPAAPTGTQVAFLQMSGAFSQAISVDATNTYSLSFDAAQRDGYPNQALTVTLGSQIIVPTLTPGSTTYQNYSYSFTPATSGSQTLTFTGLEPSGQDETVFIDQVSITSTPTEVTYTVPGSASATTAAIDSFLGVFPGATAGTYLATYTLGTAADPFTPALIGAVSGNVITLSLASGQSPWDLVGQAIQLPPAAGQTAATPLGTITGVINTDPGSGGNVTYTVSQNVSLADGTTVQTPNLSTVNPGAVFALANGDVYFWNGNGCTTSSTTSCGTTDSGITKLGSLGGGSQVNVLVNMPNATGKPGFGVGLANGEVYRWDGTIAADGTVNGGFTSLGTPGGAITAMVASPGGVIVGAGGNVYQYEYGLWFPLSSGTTSEGVSALLPYDNVQLVGAIGGTPVWACTGSSSSDCGDPGGHIVGPSYLNTLETNAPYLTPLVQGCQSGYDSGSGSGCNGYLLTVQEVSGTLKVGQTLYGGAGLAPGTTIKSQLSDNSGALCSSSCSSGGAGVYVVDRYQLVAPGSPMSASDGSGVIAGFGNGAVAGYGAAANVDGLSAWPSGGYYAAINAIVPWRDGFVVGLNWYQQCSPQGCDGSDDSNSYNGGVYSFRPSLASSWQAYTGQYDSGWTMLQGPNNMQSPIPHDNQSATWGPAWNAPVTSLTAYGDGFAVGLNPAFGDPSQTGLVGLWTPFEDQGAAFGYTPAGTVQSTTFTAASCSNGDTSGDNSGGSCSANFNQISNPGGSDGLAQLGCAGGCGNGAGTVQQMFSFDQTISVDGSGNPCTTSSTTCGTQVTHTLVVGLTNNAIFSYNSATEVWTELQAPDPSDFPPPLTGNTPGWTSPSSPGTPASGDVSLQDAFNWGQAMSASLNGASPVWSTTNGLCLNSTTCAPTAQTNPVTGDTIALPTADPMFGSNVSFNGPSPLQAYCGTSCGSHGDYIPIFAYKQLGKDGGANGIASATGTSGDFSAEIQFDVTSMSYGYLFAPNGIIDKFIPGKYSVGIITAIQAGPLVSITYPEEAAACGTDTCISLDKNIPGLSHTWETEVGSFSLGTGVDLSLTLDIPNLITTCTAQSGSGSTCTADIASAAYTTGLLYTWNPYVKTGNGGKMDMSFAKYYDYSLANLNGAAVTPTVTPYMKAEYGLFTPASTPLIGKLTVFDLGAEYSNPISAPVTYNDGTLSMDIDSQGIITTFAQFIPGITKALSWQHQFQVYNDQIADLSVNL